jgi:ABC-type glycerol-3-phosphate transport system substrate-binding protein
MSRVLGLLMCAAVLVAGCGGSAGRPAASPRGLPELTSIRQLQAAFDAHPRDPRLLILLSPT